MTQHSDDEFGLSSSDEAELLELDSRAGLKRKSEDGLPAQAKRTRVDSSALAVASRVLRERFKLEAFRLKQEAAIERLLNGDSAVVVFPTGKVAGLLEVHRLTLYYRRRKVAMLSASCVMLQRT